ncbi:MAG: SPASM domain-containing protein [Planctomycetota bacterium]|nr:SPASM domain-containing protein [Planctomycetota bacterium]
MKSTRNDAGAPVWPRLPRRAKYLPAGLKRLLPDGLKGLPAASLDVGSAQDGRRPSYYDDSLHLAGWFLFGGDRAPVRGRVSADGEQLAELLFEASRPDVTELFGISGEQGPIAFDQRIPLGGRKGRLRLELEAWDASGSHHSVRADVEVCEPSAEEARAQRLGDLEAWQDAAFDGELAARGRLASILPVAMLERPDLGEAADHLAPIELPARFDERLEIVGWCLRLDPGDASVSALELCGSDRGRAVLLAPDGRELAACAPRVDRGPRGQGPPHLAPPSPPTPLPPPAGCAGYLEAGGYRGPATLVVSLPIPGSENLFVEQAVEVTSGRAEDHAAQRRAHVDELEAGDQAGFEALLPIGELDLQAELSVRHDETVLLEGWVLLPKGDVPKRLGVHLDGVRVGTLTGGLPRKDLEGAAFVGERWQQAGFSGRVRTLERRGEVHLHLVVDDPGSGGAAASGAWSTEWVTCLVADTAAAWNIQKLREFDPRAPTPGRQMIAHYPIQLFVEFTTACQLSCLMCRHGTKVKDVPMNQYLADGHVRNLVKVLPHIKLLNMFGWGEATLHRRYTEFLRDARILNQELEIAVTSHFNKVSDELIETLIQAQITSIVISVDGASKGVYEFVRRRGDFDKVTTNIRRLVARRKQLGAQHPHIVMEFVVQKANIAELLPFVELVHDLGVDDVILEPVGAKKHLVPDYGAHLADFAAAKARAAELGVTLRGLGVSRFEQYTEGWEEANFDLSAYSPSTMTAITLDVLEAEGEVDAVEAEFTPQPEASPEELEPLLDVVALASGTAPKDSGPVDAEAVTFDPHEPLALPARGEAGDLPCYEPWQTAYINADGTITPCCWSSRVLGRLTEAGPEEIWLGDAAATLRREMLANDLDPICKRCVAMGRSRGRMDT